MNWWGVMVMIAALSITTAVILRIPTLRPAERRADDVLVVIPARNEGAVLGPLLDDLAAQSMIPARVVVVDDHSDDDTVAVTLARAGRWRALRLEVHRSADVPASWNPKSWALHQGVAGDEPRLLFLDADVRLAPHALATLSAAHHTSGGLVSVAPRHDIGTFVETLSLPFNVVAAIGASGTLRRARGQAHAAFGPCLMIARDDYDAIGGHQAVREDLLDDVALAQRFRRLGGATWLFLGGSAVRYRMYPTGFRAILDGWSKNIANGATRTAAFAAVTVGLWVTALLLPLWWLLGSRDSRSTLAAGVAWLIVGAHTAALARRVGRFGLIAVVAAPLLALFFATVSARSAVLLATRRPVRWKGRRLVARHGDLT